MQLRQFPQVSVDLDPGGIPVPLPKVILDGLPGAVLAGQIPPGATGPQDVEDAVGDAAHVLQNPRKRLVSGRVSSDGFCQLIPFSHT